MFSEIWDLEYVDRTKELMNGVLDAEVQAVYFVTDWGVSRAKRFHIIII